jgi:hypothetical protein
MENYGFELVTDEEAKQMGLPHASGLFGELFAAMQSEIEKDPKRISDYKQANKMSDVEKQISFLNRYCVFRKVASVSKETMDHFAKQADALYSNQPENGTNPELESIMNQVLNEQSASSGNIKKLKVRIILKKKKVLEQEINPIELTEELQKQQGEPLDQEPVLEEPVLEEPVLEEPVLEEPEEPSTLSKQEEIPLELIEPPKKPKVKIMIKRKKIKKDEK